MSDPGKFFLGNLVAGAGIGLSIISGGILSSVGLVIARVGVGLMVQGIRGRPSRTQAQDAHFGTEATQKVVYGEAVVGLRGRDLWLP